MRQSGTVVKGTLSSIDETAVRIVESGGTEAVRYPISKWAQGIEPASAGDRVEVTIDGKGWVRALKVLERAERKHVEHSNGGGNGNGNGRPHRTPPSDEWIRLTAIEQAMALADKLGLIQPELKPGQALGVLFKIAEQIEIAAKEGFDKFSKKG